MGSEKGLIFAGEDNGMSDNVNFALSDVKYVLEWIISEYRAG